MIINLREDVLYKQLAVPDIFWVADILDRGECVGLFCGGLEINRSFIISKMVRVFWGGLLDGLNNR